MNTGRSCVALRQGLGHEKSCVTWSMVYSPGIGYDVAKAPPRTDQADQASALLKAVLCIEGAVESSKTCT